MGRIYQTGNFGFYSSRNDTSKTKLLVHSNTTDTSTTFTDSSSEGNTLTATGNAQHSTTQKKWGTTGIKFNGAGDYVDTGTNGSALSPGTDDFTIDFWTYLTSGTEAGFFGKRNIDNDNYTSFHVLNTTAFYFKHKVSGSNIIDFSFLTTDFSLNAWHHIALTRESNSMRLFVDGILQDTETETGDIAFETVTGNLTIGETIDYQESQTRSTTGYIDEFRFVNGEAMWTSNFIPPIGPYR